MHDDAVQVREINLADVSVRSPRRLFSIVVGECHFLLFDLLRAAEYVLFIYLIYRVRTLCINTTAYMCSGPSAMTKGCLPTTMLFSCVT